MAIEVDTKDCTALSDAEMEEMADLTAEGPNVLAAGVVNKQAEADFRALKKLLESG